MDLIKPALHHLSFSPPFQYVLFAGLLMVIAPWQSCIWLIFIRLVVHDTAGYQGLDVIPPGSQQSQNAMSGSYVTV